MRHVSSRSGVATLRTAIHLSLTYLLTNNLAADRRRIPAVDQYLLPAPEPWLQVASCCEQRYEAQYKLVVFAST